METSTKIIFFIFLISLGIMTILVVGMHSRQITALEELVETHDRQIECLELGHTYVFGNFCADVDRHGNIIR